MCYVSPQVPGRLIYSCTSETTAYCKRWCTIQSKSLANQNGFFTLVRWTSTFPSLLSFSGFPHFFHFILHSFQLPPIFSSKVTSLHAVSFQHFHPQFEENKNSCIPFYVPEYLRSQQGKKVSCHRQVALIPQGQQGKAWRNTEPERPGEQLPLAQLKKGMLLLLVSLSPYCCKEHFRTEYPITILLVLFLFLVCLFLGSAAFFDHFSSWCRY